MNGTPTSGAELTAPKELRQRWMRAQQRMSELHIDSIVVGPSSDLAYLSGFSGRQSERLLLFVLPSSGMPRLLAPRFEAPRLSAVLPLADTTLWDDGRHPAELFPALLPRHGRIGLGSELFARAVLAIADYVTEPQFVDAALVLGDLRLRKSDVELELLGAAAAAADATIADLRAQPLASRSEAELGVYIAQRLVENGHDAVGHANVAAAGNTAIPHHSATREPIVKGPVLVDLGGTIGGYRSDITRTFALGDSGAEFREVYECVRLAGETAAAKVKPGVLASEIDVAARKVIDEAGYGPYFTHRTGHGIGLDVHEPPYLVAGDETVLEAGMVFSIEPGVYLPGRFGVRIEDILTVTDGGADRLNRSARELVVA